MGYVDVMVAAREKGEVLKVIDGKLKSGEPSLLQKAEGFFGLGEYSQITVANFLNEHSKAIMQEAKEFHHAGGKIAPIQTQIDSVFAKAGMVNEGIDVFASVYSNWMGSLPDAIKDKAVHDLLIPGTHDSVANHFDYSKPIHDKGGNTGFIALNKFFSIPVIGSFIGKHTVGDWGETQSLTIKEQLEHGIRAFDIRVAHDHKTGELVVSHTFTAGTFEDTLKQFQEFMDEHPSEVVLIEIMEEPLHKSPDLHNRNSAAYKKMTGLVNEYLGDKLMPPKDVHITLKDAAESGKTAMVSFTGSIPSPSNTHHNAATSYWGNKHSIDDAVKLADTKFASPYKAAVGNAAFQMYSYTVTPDAKMIVDNIKNGGPVTQPWGVKANATELNKHFSELLESHPDVGNKVTGFLFDNPDNELIEAVINHNFHDYHG